jgi:hypothetical protein
LKATALLKKEKELDCSLASGKIPWGKTSKFTVVM